MNLVIGATGIVGGEICRRLATAGKPVRAMVRTSSSPDRVEALEVAGAEVVVGDLKDPISVRRACAGAERVVSTAATAISRQPDDSIEATDLDGQRRLIDAAADAGVEHFSYLSVARAIPTDNPFVAAKRAVEDHLVASGLSYTVLGPVHFMEIWLSPFVGWDPVSRRARVLGPGDRAYSWIAVGDVAEFCVLSLDHPRARDQHIDLGGPAALTALEVVRIFEEETGHAFDVEHVPVEALRQQRAAATNPHDESLFAMMENTATQEGRIDMSETAPAFGVQLTSVRDYVRRALAPAGD